MAGKSQGENLVRDQSAAGGQATNRGSWHQAVAGFYIALDLDWPWDKVVMDPDEIEGKKVNITDFYFERGNGENREGRMIQHKAIERPRQLEARRFAEQIVAETKGFRFEIRRELFYTTPSLAELPREVIESADGKNYPVIVTFGPRTFDAAVWEALLITRLWEYLLRHHLPCAEAFSALDPSRKGIVISELWSCFAEGQTRGRVLNIGGFHEKITKVIGTLSNTSIRGSIAIIASSRGVGQFMWAARTVCSRLGFDTLENDSGNDKLITLLRSARAVVAIVAYCHDEELDEWLTAELKRRPQVQGPAQPIFIYCLSDSVVGFLPKHTDVDNLKKQRQIMALRKLIRTRGNELRCGKSCECTTEDDLKESLSNQLSELKS